MGICAAHAVTGGGSARSPPRWRYGPSRGAPAGADRASARRRKKSPARAAGVSAALPQCVRDSLARSLRALEREIKKLRARGRWRASPGWPSCGNAKRQLRSVPGDRRSQRHFRCWPRCRCCRRIATCASGWPTPDWIRGNIVRELPCAKRRASAKWVIGTCGGPCICRRW